MLIRKCMGSQAKESEVTPENLYVDRRRFLRLGAGVAAASTLAPAAAKLVMDLSDLPDSRFSTGEALTMYDKVTTYNNFYELSSDKLCTCPPCPPFDYGTLGCRSDWALRASRRL